MTLFENAISLPGGFKPGQEVLINMKNPKNNWKGEVISAKEKSRTILIIKDIDNPGPDPVIVGPGSWGRNTNNDLGKEFEVHINQITQHGNNN